MSISLDTLILFALSLAIMSGTPGPNIVALVSRVLVFGWRDVVPFIVAIWVGEAIWLTVVVFGLSTIVSNNSYILVVIKYFGVLYLLLLAWEMWNSPLDIGDSHSGSKGNSAINSSVAGITVTLGNPKIMLFYIAVLPNILNIDAVSLSDWGLLIIILFSVLSCVDCSYVVAATYFRRLFKNQKTMSFANRLGAMVMVAVALLIALR